MFRWVREVALGADKLVNALTGGDHRETVSARLGRGLSRNNSNCWVCHLLCQLLNVVDRNHCIEAYRGRIYGQTYRRKPPEQAE